MPERDATSLTVLTTTETTAHLNLTIFTLNSGADHQFIK